jgi:molybdate transport system substrate-binding protein
MVRRMRARIAATAAIAAVLTGCGSAGSGSGGGHPTLVVSAASSLRNAFADYARRFHQATVRLSLGGSDELAAQIRAGGRADVFAAANTKLPEQLFAEHRVDRPVVFAANRLVLAVPGNAAAEVQSLADVARPGVKLAVGAASVPIGSYTRKVLAALPAAERARIMANVKTEEPDVAGIVGKLTQGAVDAGFVYATDVLAAKGALRAIALPDALHPTALYAAAVVAGTRHPGAAREFVAGLRTGAGRRALLRAGFRAPPR